MAARWATIQAREHMNWVLREALKGQQWIQLVANWRRVPARLKKMALVCNFGEGPRWCKRKRYSGPKSLGLSFSSSSGSLWAQDSQCGHMSMTLISSESKRKGAGCGKTRRVWWGGWREVLFLSSVQTDFVSLPAARLRCLYKVSTQHFVLYRQNIHDTPLPFPGAVSRNTIQGSKASCLKTGLEITILASRLFLWVMVE